MSVYDFTMNLVAPGAFNAHFSKVGSSKHRDKILEEDDEAPSQSDVTSVVDSIAKDKECLIYWYPEKGRSFEPLKGKPSNRQIVLYLFLAIKDSKDATEVTFRYQVTLQGLTVVDVSKDPRMGHQVAKIGFTALAKERK